jgi:hypothetical protein
VIVESGWGSMVPTVVLANMSPTGAAARCGQLNIGDQIISINCISLVGLPLSTCQSYIKVESRLKSNFHLFVILRKMSFAASSGFFQSSLYTLVHSLQDMMWNRTNNSFFLILLCYLNKHALFRNMLLVPKLKDEFICG